MRRKGKITVHSCRYYSFVSVFIRVGPHFLPYLQKTPVDSWGHDYIYLYPRVQNPSSYDLSSTGPNGNAGNADGIRN